MAIKQLGQLKIKKNPKRGNCHENVGDLRSNEIVTRQRLRAAQMHVVDPILEIGISLSLFLKQSPSKCNSFAVLAQLYMHDVDPILSQTISQTKHLS